MCCWLWTLCHTIQHRAVLIIFPLNFQTITITRMLSSGGEGAETCVITNRLTHATQTFSLSQHFQPSEWRSGDYWQELNVTQISVDVSHTYTVCLSVSIDHWHHRLFMSKSHSGEAVWFSLTKTKMSKNEKIMNSLTKMKTKKWWKRN